MWSNLKRPKSQPRPQMAMLALSYRRWFIAEPCQAKTIYGYQENDCTYGWGQA